MARDIIRPKSGTPSRAPLSPAVRTGNLVFVSGTPAFYGDRQIAKGDFPAQMHQVMKNLQAVLAAAGSGLHKVVKVNVDESPTLAARFGASSIPLLVVLRGGEGAERILGAQPLPALEARLSLHLA